METTGRKWARYGLAVLAGALIALLAALRQGLDLAEPAYQNARHLSDGCFVAGLLLAGVGGLAAIAATGFFDMFAYAFHSLAV
ncbi:MAG: DUF3899 domain-containing protein, partial [Clostridiales bacterium]|nr:DUF3899 domain-containing protein [Clostridiales bacterium]